jgi:hypothetical protein
MKSYHSLSSESLDLLDGAGSSLLEANTMHLLNTLAQHCSKTVVRLRGPKIDPGRISICKRKKRTLLWRWMVYSRATTSAMAERWALPEDFLADDISEAGC